MRVPGEIVYRGNYRYKVTRGMASASARRDQLEIEKSEKSDESRKIAETSEVGLIDYVPEGVEAIVPYKGGAVNVIRQLVGGLKSGLSYCGAGNLAESSKERRIHENHGRRSERIHAARRRGHLAHDQNIRLCRVCHPGSHASQEKRPKFSPSAVSHNYQIVRASFCFV